MICRASGSRLLQRPLAPYSYCLLTSGRPNIRRQNVGHIFKGSQQECGQRGIQSTASGTASAGDDPTLAPELQQQPEQPPVTPGIELDAYHYLTFLIMLGGGLVFLAVVLYFTSDSLGFQKAMGKVIKRLAKTVALRQLGSILAAIVFVRYGLEPLIKNIRSLMKAQGSWEKSSEYYIIKELYKPLEFLFLIAALTTLAENFLPQLISVPKSIVQAVVKSTLALTFVIAAARVVFNIKGRIVRETSWQLELKGDLTRQRRIEAFDKLLSVLTLLVTAVFGLQAIGLDVNSVLAIGGVGGIAIGLAGREILENLFTGLIILSSNPFEVGDEVLFRPASGQVVEGIVIDVGWYRTTIRSFEREVYNIPNSIFLKNVVLNITRKNREWRFFEFLPLRVEDLERINPVVSDIRKILRQDARIIQKLHRRVFLDKITKDDISIYVSFYVEATNRDAFMAVKQDLLLAFVDCVERNGAKLARNRLQIQVMPAPAMNPLDNDETQIVDILPSLPQPASSEGASMSSQQPKDDGGSGNSSSSSGGGSSTTNTASTSSGSSSTSSKGSSNIVPSASPPTTSSKAGVVGSAACPPSSSGIKQPISTTSSSSSSAAAAMLNNPSTMSKIVATVAPDAIITSAQEGGQTYVGSFDECTPPPTTTT